MKRVREAGEMSPGRVCARGVQGRAQSARQVHPQVVPQEAREALPAAPAASSDGSVKSEPVWQASVQATVPSGLPKELWQHILSGLDDHALRRMMQTCRTLYRWARDLPLDDRSRESIRQQKQSDSSLNAILPQNRISQAELASLATEFEELLTQFATRFRSLRLSVHPGFEDAVLKALLAGQRWKMASLCFHRETDHALIRRLEAGLLQQNRSCSVELETENPKSLEGFLPSGTALDLKSLVLKRVDTDLDPISTFLKSQNGLRRLYLLCDDAPDDFLPGLQEGTHALTQLHLDDFPSKRAGLDLIKVLEKKPQLRTLELANGEFRKDGLNLPMLLAAAPKLETLLLCSVSFTVGASAGCAQALGTSRLRLLTIDECMLEIPSEGERSVEQLKACKSSEHQDLLQGLRSAPCLNELNILAASNLDIETMLLAGAFAQNPNARILRHDRAVEPLPLRALVDEINLLRATNQQVQLYLESMANQ